MSRFERKVLAVQAPHAEKALEPFADFTIVATVNLNNRIVFVLEKEKGPGRLKKVDGKDD